jgi:tripartite-type tricarboxylate transporter receptor subunit TctC
MRTALLLLCLVFPFRVDAQTYPSHPVKVLVPFPAGSATDQVARLAGAQLQEALGQPFIIENKAGAQGAIAAVEVAKAAPDGYTLMVTTNTYDPVKDFTPITRYGTTSFMLMVKPEFPAKSLKEFIAYVRSQPGRLSAGYGSSGSQVSLAMIKQLGKLDVVEVPYKGIPQTITDTMGGSLAFTFVDLANALTQARGGKLRGIAITAPGRTPLAPELAAIAEELPGYEIMAWFGLVAPAKLPDAIVQRLHEANIKGLAKQDMKDKYGTLGLDIATQNPAEFGKFIQSEVALWAKLVKLAGIQPE